MVQMCTRRWLFKGDQTNLQQVKVFYIMELLSAPLKKKSHLICMTVNREKKSYLKSKKETECIIIRM